MMLSSRTVDRGVDPDWKPQRNSSPLDSWSPAAPDAAPRLNHSQDGGEDQRRSATRRAERRAWHADPQVLTIPRGVLLATLKGRQPPRHLPQIGEVVGSEHLALHHRQVELDLVQPGRMDRQADQVRVRPARGETVDRSWPRWLEPLSTTQNTRRAVAYGAVLITWSTSLVNGSIPAAGSQRPNTRA